jgi:predicted nuclease of predicted toxin-antitoxin system
MTLWVDAQISPAIAAWLRMRFEVNAVAVRDLGLESAGDPEIFAEAKRQHVVVMTKHSDFIDLLERHGPRPQVIWVRSGNTSNARLKQILSHALPPVLQMIGAGEPLVEIGDAW